MAEHFHMANFSSIFNHNPEHIIPYRSSNSCYGNGQTKLHCAFVDHMEFPILWIVAVIA